jgi:hypothetical protein
MTDKNIDKAKGRAKEAAGALSGNQRLKDEGAATRPRARSRTPRTKPSTPSAARSSHARTNH